MEEPEARHFLSRKFLGASPTPTRHRGAFRVEDLDQTSEQLHQPLARAHLHAGWDVLRVIDEVTRTVSLDTGDGKRDHVFALLDIESELKILAPEAHRLLVTARCVVEHWRGFG